MAFGKFSTCAGRPFGDVALYSDHVDWEGVGAMHHTFVEASATREDH